MAAVAVQSPSPFMAISNLLAPPTSSSSNNGPPNDNIRASHILPTIKCTTCSQPIPLSAIADHVCAPRAPSPEPAPPPKSTLSIASTSSSSTRPPARAPSPAASLSSRTSSSRVSHASSAFPTPSLASSRSAARSPSPQPPLPTSANRSIGTATAARIQAGQAGHLPQVAGPSRPPLPLHVHNPSVVSSHFPAPSLAGDIPRSLSPASIHSASPVGTQGQRIPSPVGTQVPRIPSPIGNQVPRIPSPVPSHHSNHSVAYSHHHAPSAAAPPLPQQQQPPQQMPQFRPGEVLHLQPGQHMPMQQHLAPTAPDTASGGAAGMAGVGRRAFAAAAQAAMFAHSQGARQRTRQHHLAPVDVEGANMAPQPTQGQGSQVGSPSFLSLSSPHSPLSPASLGHPSPTYPPARTPSPLNPQHRRPSNAGSAPREVDMPGPASLPVPELSQLSPSPSPRPSMDLPETDRRPSFDRSDGRPSMDAPSLERPSFDGSSGARRPSVDLPAIAPLKLTEKKRSLASNSSRTSASPSIASVSESMPLTIPIPPKTALIEPSQPSPSPSTTTPRLPFFEKYKQLAAKPPQLQTQPQAQTLPTPSPSSSAPSIASPPLEPPSPISSSGNFGSELAYRQRDSNGSSVASSQRKGKAAHSVGGGRPERSPTDPGPSAALRQARQPVNSMTSMYSQGSNEIVFPTRTPSGSASVSAASASRKMSSASSSSFGTSPRSTSKSTGAIEKVMETLLEEPTPSLASGSSVSDRDRDKDRVKLPQRSHTTPASMSKEAKERQRRKERTCVKCGERIRDGRWIQREGSGVLCERDWKEMYLPKCRRCELPIERHAVSSSDGQLKGKYHRDCFNCDQCREPFPDKTFYVFDGKPYCAYHYHARNGSLCAGPRCGQPIEGPCAVTHSGVRFHPEHLVCDHDGCGEQLEDYWEVGGKKLCERHGVAALTGSPTGTTAPDWGRAETLAAKRKTRFVDLVRGVSAGKK